MDLEFQLCFSSAAPSLLFPSSAPSTTFALAFIPAPPLSLSIFFFPPALVSRQRHRSDRQRDERRGEREARVRKPNWIKSSCTTNSSSRPAGQPANQSASQPVSQSASQSVSQPVSQRVDIECDEGEKSGTVTRHRSFVGSKPSHRNTYLFPCAR